MALHYNIIEDNLLTGSSNKGELDFEFPRKFEVKFAKIENN